MFRLPFQLLLRPFPRFLALGALIFDLHALVAPPQAPAGKRIEISAAEVERLREMALKEWGRAPDQRQLATLIRDQVREEVLVREARRAGLDQDDTIVRRRLAQKMEFLAQAEVPAPSETEIEAWYTDHRESYQTPPALRLEQRFFSRRLRGPQAQDDASRALSQLRAGRPVAADEPVLDAALPEQTEASLTRDFGAAFANAVQALPEGRWSAPIESPFGVHLVRVQQRLPVAHAPLDTVRERVRVDCLNARIAAAREAAYARAKSRYEITVATTPGEPPRVADAGTVTERQP